MKLLTLNTHSLVEEEYEKKLSDFVDAISRELPDIIALQEVNQTCTQEAVSKQQNPKVWELYCPCKEGCIVRKDNHVFNVVKRLSEKGIFYYWTWLGMKLGYGKYDEGIAVLSKSPIVETDVFLISQINDYQNWKTRKIIGIRTKANPKDWFYSVHMGWWQDEEEPFEAQWKRICCHMKDRESVWLMGDFNSPAAVKEEGYELIKKSGWYDTFLSAVEKDSGITVEKVIDGWKDKIDVKASDREENDNPVINGMRIDQIWSSQEVVIKSSKVIFNGKKESVVSDHYGIVVEW